MSSLALARPGQRVLLLAVALFAFVVFAAAGAERASACVTQPFSPAPLANSFEGADGDQCDSDGLGPRRDWQNVTASPGFVSTTDAPSTADTLYGPNNAGIVGGSSDENVPDSWNFTIGNLGSSKFDALAAYSFTDPLNNSLFLDLAFVRAAASGATFLAFELNQRQPGYRTDPNEVVPSQPFKVPTRTRGDLLVTYDVNNAGAIALGLCVWDGNEHTGRWEEFKQDLSGNAITNQPCPAISTSLYQAALNDGMAGRQGDIPAAENFLGTGQVDQGRFGEAVVNLSDALMNPANPNGPQPCVDFGYVWMHSRSSDSLTSSQQDFILPASPVSIANCSVEGRKFEDVNANGADDGEPGLGGWTMFVDYNGNGVLDNNRDATFVNDMDGVVEPGEEEPYAVTSDGTDGNAIGTYKITDVQPGTWPIREVLKPTWDCTAAIGAGAVAGCPERTDTDPDTAQGFTLTWAHNESFSGRDFGNHRQPATLRVIKHVVNDSGGTAAASAWSLHVKSGASDVTGSPQAGSETGSVYTLTDGQSYDVSETGGPAGYAATFSGDCNSSGAVTVAAGTEKTCTITNNDVAPTIKVVKHVVNDDGGTAAASAWQLHLASGGSDVAGSPKAGSETGDTYTVSAGAYHVSETSGPSGYAASFSGDCDASGNLTAGLGETKVCTVTNDDIAPKVRVVKHVINDDGGTAAASAFTMTVDDPGTNPASVPGDENGTDVTVDPGHYSVSESGPSGYAASLSADCDATIAIGETKTCTVTNNDIAPTIKVVKHVVNDDGGTASASNWQLHLSKAGTDVAGSPKAGSETGDTYTVSAGTFNVSETGGPSGYAASFSGDCNANGNVAVGIGESKTCTITNDDIAATVHVVKHVINDNGGTASASAATLALDGTAGHRTGITGDENGIDIAVHAGHYAGTETSGPAGYAVSYSADCDANIALGETKTCTVTNNDIPPTIKVVKHVVNDNGGTASASNWQLHLADGGTDVTGSPQAGSEAGDTYTVAAGSFAVSETGGPAGYAASFSGDCNAAGNVAVGIGESKTCTLTNDDIAPRLKVVKHVVNKGGSAAQASDFQMDVTATDPSQAHFPGNEQGVTITLDAGAYSVDESGGPTTFAKQLSADCAGLIAIGTEKTCTITNTKVLPGGVVVKKGPAFAYHGDQLTFTFEVTNPGTTPLKNIVVSDDKCAPVSGPVQKLGGNADALLDVGETWVYTCSMTTPAHTAGDTNLVNVVTMSATDADGEPVGDTDQHTTRILHPAIAIDKTGPATAQAGQPIDYALVVTNPGDVPFLAANVNVSDALCEAPPLLVTTNGDATPGQLDPGDTWGYMCRVRTLVGQTQVVNVGVVTGKDSFAGRTVTDDDPATTQLTQPPAAISIAPQIAAPAQSGVLAATAESGTARLTGPAKCAKGPFEVRVTGRAIAQVRFALDGRTIKTIKAINGRTVFKVKINPRGGGSQMHRVTARVTFTGASATKARTLRYVYLRCPRQAVLPQFTG
jgi:uncharacterized repeat protein (TIGR01451 family)